jgi:hypothetical protein
MPAMARSQSCTRHHAHGRRGGRVTARVAEPTADGCLRSTPPSPASRNLREYGRFVARVDFYWEDFGVVGESDGNLKYERGARAIVEEKARHKELEELGLVVVRWGWADLFPFDKVARRLRAAYVRGLPVGSPERRWGVLLPHRLHS